jgi:hypothetical protein
MCTHVYKCKKKMVPVETIPGIGVRKDKGDWWKG